MICVFKIYSSKEEDIVEINKLDTYQLFSSITNSKFITFEVLDFKTFFEVTFVL